MSSRSVSYVVCVGAAKAGTTTLYEMMSRHPGVAVSKVKETGFYSNSHFDGSRFDEYIASYFHRTPATEVLFEADPGYMYVNGCVERLRASAPDARLVVMLRNPVDRAFSQYKYRMAYQRYDESFEKMCQREADRIGKGDAQRLEYGCLDRSRYAPQIAEILRHFPREQIFFLLFERFIKDQRGEFAALQRWLGIREIDVEQVRANIGGPPRSVFIAKFLYHPKFKRLRRAFGRLLPAHARWRISGFLGRLNLRDAPAVKPTLDPNFRRCLLDKFSEDIVMVEKMTGLDLTLWRSA